MSDLHLVRLVLDRRALARVAARHRHSQRLDAGYFLHAGLAQLFATSEAPAEVPLHTFAHDDLRADSVQDPTAVFLLAYADHDAQALRRAMNTAQDVLRECQSRPMPAFEAGQRLGFRTRVCPITRTRTPGDRPLGIDARGKTKCREIDAFVHATLSVSKETRVDREEVYTAWLRAQLTREGACTLDAVRLTAFQREGMHRRGSPRIERPNAVMEGALTVTDPAAFTALLARGIGRHRAFGFGMLLLGPPPSH
ncbi:MAG: type I-E CRISPR-associated protein Cas6/Cse3/CasE [Myxococcales bacterium]|nr:type I-E CRISPR-associated protein Cas6/Cse3/CasE [Myxococcales bacterium]